jgi:hypothetical protein
VRAGGGFTGSPASRLEIITVCRQVPYGARQVGL